MYQLNQDECKLVDGSLGIAKLIGAMAIGGVSGALRGISGGPIGMLGGAIFGAGLGAAGCAINDAAYLAEKKQLNH